MATEYEELQLRVTLVDEATPKLLKMQDAVKSMGGGEQASATRKLHDSTKESTELFKVFGKEIGDTAEKFVALTRTTGPAAAAFAAIGFAAQKSFEAVKEFSAEMIKLDQISRRTGLQVGVIKGLSEQLAEAGVSGEAAIKTIEGIGRSIGDLNQPASQLRKTLADMVVPRDVPEMLSRLTDIAHSDAPEAANKIRALAERVRELVTAQRGAQAGAAAAMRIYKQFGAEALADLDRNFDKIDEKYLQRMEMRKKAAQEFTQEYSGLSNKLDEIHKTFGSIIADSKMMEETMKGLNKGAGEVSNAFHAVEDYMHAHKAAMPGVMGVAGALMPGPLGPIMQMFDTVRRFQAVHAEENRHAQITRWGRWHGSIAPKGAGGGGGGGGFLLDPALAGGGGGEWTPGPSRWTGPDFPRSTNIEDRRGEQALRDDVRATQENTAQLRRLNDFLQVQPELGQLPDTAAAGSLADKLGYNSIGRGLSGAGGGAGGGGGGGGVGLLGDGGGGGGGGLAGLGGGGVGQRVMRGLGGIPGLGGLAGVGAARGGMRLPGHARSAAHEQPTAPQTAADHAGPGQPGYYGDTAAGVQGMAGSPSGPPAARGGGGGGGPVAAGAGGAVNPAALRSRLEGLIKGSSLEGFVPPDAAKYGMKSGSAHEWANLMTGMAGRESSFNTGTVGDVGRFGSGSRGLFQLSSGDALTYGLQKTPFTKAQLADPDFNAQMAVKIAAIRAHAGGIGGAQGMAKYWAGSRGYLARGGVSAAGNPYGNDSGPGVGAGAGESAGQTANEHAGVGGARNYFQHQGASPLAKGQLQQIETPYGKFDVNPQAAESFKGWLEAMKAQGAPIKTMGFYNVRKMRRGNAWSSHSYASAGDIDDEASLSPAMKSWIAQHPKEWQQSLQTHNLSQPYPGWDAPHIEWAGPRAKVDQQMTHRVQGSGQIDVNVNAPRWTQVRAGVSGLFHKVSVNREHQMEPAATSAHPSADMAGPG